MPDSFTEQRPRLFSITTAPAPITEDILQLAFLRWQAADQTTVESPKAFLTTIFSRPALDCLKRAHRNRILTSASGCLRGPLSEPVDLAEALFFEFLHLFESAPARERIAFLVRVVFDAELS